MRVASLLIGPDSLNKAGGGRQMKQLAISRGSNQNSITCSRGRRGVTTVAVLLFAVGFTSGWDKLFWGTPNNPISQPKWFKGDTICNRPTNKIPPILINT